MTVETTRRDVLALMGVAPFALAVDRAAVRAEVKLFGTASHWWTAATLDDGSNPELARSLAYKVEESLREVVGAVSSVREVSGWPDEFVPLGTTLDWRRVDLVAGSRGRAILITKGTRHRDLIDQEMRTIYSIDGRILPEVAS